MSREGSEARRWAAALDALEARLGRWPAACAALLGLLVLLGAALFSRC